VVGRTDYCISPPEEVAKLPSVGGPKSLEVAKIVALRPDLVWADAEENGREEVEALIDAGLRVFVALPRTVSDVASFLRRTALLCATDTARERAAGEAQRLEALGKASGSGFAKGNAVRAVALIWRNPYMSFTPHTLSGALLEAAGFTNLVAAGSRPYPELSEGEIAALAPEVLLLPSEPYLFTGEDAKELEQIFPGTATLLFPGEWLCWYGLRTSEQVEKLRKMKKIHGDSLFLV
jgi:ABC-type Fe3+-hydroxamate transport system substrate-binding protein